ncbi:MAG: bifunctional nuclease family protein [Treponema sp.]|jgi:bifunctional DNase/RNase|nr:bifunctional nuclease family protein [Treponema sp.]
MKEAEIWGVAETSEGNVVFIKPLDSEYSVPIFIGQLEAQSILIGFGGIVTPRPLTADLILGLAREAEFALDRVEIRDLRDNTFYARLVFSRPRGEEILMDSRPSDALALAVRCKCPLYIAEKVVKEAGVPADDLTGASKTDREAQKAVLKAELEEAVAAENYERAAELRDALILLDNSGENA